MLLVYKKILPWTAFLQGIGEQDSGIFFCWENIAVFVEKKR